MWPDDAIALPTRDGQDVGGAQERTMLAFASGAAGIRTVEEINPDGSITRLRTRYGWPTFETEGARTAAAETQLRGFVAKVPGGRAVLFDPYTMEILKTPYVPAAKLYEVQDFLTESTWYDVVLFDGTTIKVNAKAMPTLRITANHGYEAIPHVINYTAGDQYGNAERNTTEKRVFAVGRYSVTSWGGGGVTETLTPTEPRTESRALTIGQRIDGDTAYLGELYHGIDGWDSATEWYFRSAEIQMLLTAAYLVKTSVGANVAMTVPTMASTGSGATGSMTTPTTLPPTAIGMSATPTVGHYANYPTTVNGIVYFYWSDIVVKPMDGTIHANYSRDTYAVTPVSDTEGARTYSATNVKTYDSRSEYPTVDAQTIPFTDDVPTITDMRLNASGSDHLYWSLVDEGLTIDLGPMRGQASNYCEGEDVGARPIVSRDYETQNGSFVVSFYGIETARVTMFREYSTGEQWVATPNLTYYDPYMGLGGAAEYYGDVVGIGIYSWPYVEPYNDGGSNPVSDYKRIAGVQAPAVIDEINAALNSMVDALMTQTVYQSENAEGYYSRPAPWSQGHYLSSTTTEDKVESSLSWTTKDFILYDPTNEVYITVEGSFTGVDNEATLTVLLKVQTRHHTTTQTLGEFSYTYGEMLVEREFDTGLYAVPSPQIRAIFAPLYCEQGSFKGAHYVTQAEEDGGIAAFHGFNFVLNLRMYSDFDTCNDDNAGQQVYFVPCNLLEMLYAFVFSTEYGVAEDGTRYPVTYTTRFNEMRDTMFATPVRVAVKDGSATNWTDTLGGDFAAVSTVALYRT
ncbi:MAG: hypothetical protein V5B38_04840 [Candidatus Accumulibacter propinquus]